MNRKWQMCRNSMENNVILLVFLLVSICEGYSIYGAEQKRQGLIPFPRVGRSFFPPQIQIDSVLDASDLDDDAFTDAFADDLLGGSDQLAARYPRSMYSPRLGRRKRSSPDVISSSDVAAIAETMDDLNDALRGTPWAIIAYRDSMDKKMSGSRLHSRGNMMAPRLGRKRSDGSAMTTEQEMMVSTAKRSGPPLMTGPMGLGMYPHVGSRGSLGDLVLRENEIENRSAFSPRLGRSVSGSTSNSNPSKSS